MTKLLYLVSVLCCHRWPCKHCAWSSQSQVSRSGACCW